MSYKWRLELHVGCCHRWFRDLLTDRISAADESGEYPEDTDDGVLWLDTTSSIALHYDYDGEGRYCEEIQIPLLNVQGQRTWLGGTTEREAREVAELFNMPLLEFSRVGPQKLLFP